MKQTREKQNWSKAQTVNYDLLIIFHQGLQLVHGLLSLSCFYDSNTESRDTGTGHRIGKYLKKNVFNCVNQCLIKFTVAMCTWSNVPAWQKKHDFFSLYFEKFILSLKDSSLMLTLDKHNQSLQLLLVLCRSNSWSSTWTQLLFSTQVSAHYLCEHTQHAVIPPGLQAGPEG